MEKNRKDLKTLSILILILTGLTLARSVTDLIVNGLPQVPETDGLSQGLLRIVAIISLVIGLLLLLPQIYIGIKGMQIADGATSGKAPLVWAIILAVLAAISTISGLSNMLGSFTFGSALNFVDCALDVVVYIFYFIFARKVILNK